MEAFQKYLHRLWIRFISSAAVGQIGESLNCKAANSSSVAAQSTPFEAA